MFGAMCLLGGIVIAIKVMDALRSHDVSRHEAVGKATESFVERLDNLFKN